VAHTFNQFIEAKVSPAIGSGGEKAVLYLQHLKAMLSELSSE